MAEHEALDHPRIDDERIVDRYLAGRLAAADEARFEEHLFACTDCLAQVEQGEELRRGLRAVAAEEATRATAAQGLATVGLLAWLRQRRPAQLAAFLSLAVVGVLLPAVVLWQQAELRRLRSAPPPVIAGLREPLADFQVVSLGLVRDAGEVEIRPDPEKPAILLSLELSVVTSARYRVSLYSDVGELLWRGDDLEPNLYDTLLVAVPASYLVSGSYRVAVEGLPMSDSGTVSELAFRVLPAE